MPFRVLDALERLLLNEGQVIHSDSQLETLVERGAWVGQQAVLEQRARRAAGSGKAQAGSARPHTLFDRWERRLWELDAALRHVLKGHPLKDLTDDARLLRMADVFMAKITPRAKRPPQPPQLAARQLFEQEAGSPLAASLIKGIGIHPPGSLVTLKSGEVAVVTRRAKAGNAPLVCTLSGRKRQPSIN